MATASNISGMVRREVAERFLSEHQFFDFWFRFHGCLLFFIRCLSFFLCRAQGTRLGASSFRVPVHLCASNSKYPSSPQAS
jgi:hypothetical protein